MIGVIDYEAGNIASISNALSRIGSDFMVSADVGKLRTCTGIILPGVGAAPTAMSSLQDRNLPGFLVSLKVPFLGICLGMQLLYKFSEEGNTPCLGVLPGSVRTINPAVCRVPHIGWNSVEFIADHPLIAGVKRSAYFYFAHSYAAHPDASAAGVSDCGVPFAAAVFKDNYLGVQFHPEKSDSEGLRLLKNFDDLCRTSRP